MLSHSRKPTPVAHRRDLAVARLTEVPDVLSHLTDRMLALGYNEMEVFHVRLAVEEAVVNAIRHGHQGDSSRPVQVSSLVSQRHVLVRIQDQGDGFDPYQIPDPLADESLDRDHGRGIFLMKAAMTWVKFNAQGNCVTLCKKRMR